jgi:predicted nucleic acid-binding protein
VNGLVLDTDVVSALRRIERDPALAAWLAGQDGAGLRLTAVTLLELEVGVRSKEKADPTQGAILRTWLEAVRMRFADAVLPFDADAAAIGAEISLMRTRGLADVLIAATALAAGYAVATRNTKDFADIPGLTVVNPWLPTL